MYDPGGSRFCDEVLIFSPMCEVMKLKIMLEMDLQDSLGVRQVIGLVRGRSIIILIC